MLSQKELTSLSEIIQDDFKTFESIATDFQKSFQKVEQFKVGITLWFLIKDNLLSLTQRLASFYIIYEMNKLDNMKTTPFVPIVLETIQNSQNNAEKRLLSELLSNGSRDISKFTIKQFVEDSSKISEFKLPDLKECWEIHDKEKEKFSTIISDWIRPVIYDNEENKAKQKGDYPTDINFSHFSSQEFSLNYFEPNYLTFYPNSSYPFFEDEPLWIIPTLKYEFIWDLSTNKMKSQITRILDKAIEGKPISTEEESEVFKYLEENPNYLPQIMFSPQRLMKIIEKNTKFGAQIFIKIGKSENFEKYILPFVENTVTVHIMEALNIIYQNVEIPTHFFLLFIKNIINTHKEMKEPRGKRQFFKYFCVFLTNIIEFEHIRIEDVKIDLVKNFLYEYSADKEASSLLLKIFNEKKNN